MIKRIFLLILDPLIYLGLQWTVWFGIGIFTGISMLAWGMTGEFDVDALFQLQYIVILISAIMMLFILSVRDLKKPTVKERWAIGEIGFKNGLILFILGFYGNILCACVLFFLQSRFHMGIDTQKKLIERMLGEHAYFLVLMIVVVIPLIEEWIFRMSVIQRLTMASSGKGTIIFIQALLFAFFHMRLGQSFFTFIFGIFLGAAYFRFRSVVAPMIMRMSFNGAGIIIAWFPHIQKQLSDFYTLAITIGIAVVVVIVCIGILQLFRGQLTVENGDIELELDIEQMEAAYWEMGKMH